MTGKSESYVIATSTYRTGCRRYASAASLAEAKVVARRELGVSRLPGAHHGPYGGNVYAVGGLSVAIYRDPQQATP